MGQDRIIDGDGHVLEPPDLWLNYIEEPFKDRAPRIVMDAHGMQQFVADRDLLRRGTAGLHVVGIPGIRWTRADVWKDYRYEQNHPGGFDPHARIQDMDQEGIDVAVLYPTLGLYLGAIEDGALAAAICRAYNNWLADYCKASPERLIGVAIVPLQEVEEAVKELRRTVGDLGFKGVFIRPNPYRGRTLDDPVYDPFWAEAEHLDVPVGIHEGSESLMPTAGAERFGIALGRHLISHPHEQQIACAQLIFGGVLERFPRLQVAFLEAGVGWIAHWLERMDEHYEEWPYQAPQVTMNPSEYFLRQCYISCEPDERTLPAMVQFIGEDRIIFASDYPHHDATFPGAVAELKDRQDLPEEAKRKILGENAARLYGIV